jgi:hypothetical protein
MLNDAFVRDQAEQLASRVTERGGTTTQERVDSAFRLALARGPTAAELAWCSELLARQARQDSQSGAERDGVQQSEHAALVSLCHVLLNTNEFLYVE